MFRSSLIAAGAVLLCSAGYAQQARSLSDLRPVTGVPQRAGVFNYATKRWLPAQQAAQLSASAVMVYDNTCTWGVGLYYVAEASCEVFFDEGVIPGGLGGNGPVGATVDNMIDFFEFSYCTDVISAANGGPGVDLTVAFYESQLKDCLGAGTTNPPPLSTTATAYFDFGAAAGFPLPGYDPVTGNNCWILGINMGNAGFCMKSDGDGIWDNQAALDNFGWSVDMNNVTPNQGMFLSGEPTSSAVGGCTYNIPCGTDLVSGGPCGHGFRSEDNWWGNVDGDGAALGLTGPGCLDLAAGEETACWWFGGWQSGGPFSGFYMKMGSAGACAPVCTGTATNYCTAGTTTHGCNAAVSMTGVPSASNAGPCMITVSNVEGAQTGLIFYGLTPLGAPWGNGSSSFLCVKAPAERMMTPTGTGGTVNTCSGGLSVNANAYWAANPSAPHVGMPISVGEVFYFQGWFRDPGAPKTSSLSNGLYLTVCP